MSWSILNFQSIMISALTLPIDMDINIETDMSMCVFVHMCVCVYTISRGVESTMWGECSILQKNSFKGVERLLAFTVLF